MMTASKNNQITGKKYLRGIFSFLLGISFGTFICFRRSLFWQGEQSNWLTILLIYALMFIISYYLSAITIQMFMTNAIEVNQIGIFLSLAISFPLGLWWYLGRPSRLPQNWLTGFGIWIESATNILIVIFVLPLLIYLMVTTLFRSGKYLSKKRMNLIVSYRYFFCLFLLLLAFVPGILSVPKMEQYEKTFIGSVHLRESFSVIRYFLGDSIFKDAIVSKGNWLVFANQTSLNDYQNVWPFSEELLNEMEGKINRLNEHLKSQGRQLVIVIPPSKNTIYPEYVPETIPVMGERSRYDQMNALLTENESLIYIDLRDILLNAKEEMQVYYATDTHWNPHGVFFAYQAIMQELTKTYPEITPHQLCDYAYETTPIRGGDLALNMMNMGIHEAFYQLTLTEKINLEFRDVSDSYKEYINPNSPPLKLLVFHDSFGVGLTPFLRQDFSRSVFINLDKIDPFYFDSEDPDIVMIIWTERALGRLLDLPDL